MINHHFDSIILGAGAAGISFAESFAQDGRKLCLLDPCFGGTSYAHGALPVKMHIDALTRSRPSSFKEAKEQFLQIQKNLQQYLFNQQQYLAEIATLVPVTGIWRKPHSIQADTLLLHSDNIVLATGSHLSFPKAFFAMARVLDHRSLFAMGKLPQALFIIGLGVEAVEFACLYASYGIPVVLCGQEDSVLYEFSDSLTEDYIAMLNSLDIQILLHHRVIDITEDADNAFITLVDMEDSSKQLVYKAPYVLLTGERRANVPTGFEGTLENGYILIDDQYRTTIPSVYAIGDCNGQSVSLGSAILEGQRLAARLRHSSLTLTRYNAKNVYTQTVHGLIEISGAGSMRGPHASCELSDTPRGFSRQAKGRAMVYCDPNYERVNGIWFVGPYASDYAGLGSLLLEKELKLSDLYDTAYPNPCVSEALRICAKQLLHSNVIFLPQNS